MGGWTQITPAAEKIALGVTRGGYQQKIVEGYQSMSGSTLGGNAKKNFLGSYRRSRANLLRALAKAGLKVEFDFVHPGRVMFVCTADELLNAPIRDKTVTTVRGTVELIAREDAKAAAKAARREKRLAKADMAALAALG